jgi:hypothetical protein
VIFPSIHLNGTSAESLLEDYGKAAEALRLAIEAMYVASPNARDYYPQGPEACELAVKEHRERCAKVRAAREEILTIMEHIDTVLLERKPFR